MSPRVRSIIEAVAAEHRVTVADIMGRSHYRWHTQARREAMCRLRALSRWNGARGSSRNDAFSYNAIARIFGRDHSTVMWACRDLSTGLPIAGDMGKVARCEGEQITGQIAA